MRSPARSVFSDRRANRQDRRCDQATYQSIALCYGFSSFRDFKCRICHHGAGALNALTGWCVVRQDGSAVVEIGRQEWVKALESKPPSDEYIEGFNAGVDAIEVAADSFLGDYHP